MKNFEHILLFKTNCHTLADKQKLQRILEEQQGIEEWNLDQDDSDFVLRVISHTLCTTHITQLLNHYGYECCELT